jgi:hypothetical protein
MRRRKEQIFYTYQRILAKCFIFRPVSGILTVNLSNNGVNGVEMQWQM